MKTRNKFKAQAVGLSVWGVLTAMTLLLYFFIGTRDFTDGGLLIVWCFFSWNFFAYAFDKGMFPRIFVELDGQGKGVPGWRAFWFWFAAIMYLALLATIAWAD